ncbi:hypothetical protein LLEC1_06128 [Akanthomyces lecanii]|uniref:Uncharacterized protein n=1 Tax=Cordyceps confragosa TaxID=2714763 RepID=A0A179I4B9_CORDF|nr:hypothetical protein LLEC1_06128 [Akanthomyces lecanii]
MASSNPFRKSVLQPKIADATPPLDPIDTTQTHVAPPRTSFRALEPSDPNDEPEPERKQKPVKKVRVLTPPPLSPDSPEWPEVEPMHRTGAGLVPPPVDYDPFGGSATDESDRDSTATPPNQRSAASGFPTAPSAPGGPPGNPFSRTLQDMEDTANKEELDLQQREEGEVLKAANADTPALNVDAFKRLFEATSDKGGPKKDRSVASSSTSNKDKKLVPPPPPSSRHGKTIKGEQPKPAQPESEHPSAPLETKPTSHIPNGDGVESDSDEDSSTDSSPSEDATPSSAKKPAPAPPPRRGHARSDTRSNLMPPPPPPPRHRGSSSPTRKTSAGRPDADSSKGADILADLDALRREVEALRGGR